MALFKVFKGSNTDKIIRPGTAGYITPTTLTDGYAYYDTSTKLFYIDADYAGNGSISRQPINAGYAGYAGTALNGIYYGVCGTAQSTKTKLVSLVDDTGFRLTAGILIIVKFTNASAESPMKIQIDGLSDVNDVYQYGTTPMSNDPATSGWEAGALVPFIFDGSSWYRFYWNNNAVEVVSLI